MISSNFNSSLSVSLISIIFKLRSIKDISKIKNRKSEYLEILKLIVVVLLILYFLIQKSQSPWLSNVNKKSIINGKDLIWINSFDKKEKTTALQIHIVQSHMKNSIIYLFYYL